MKRGAALVVVVGAIVLAGGPAGAAQHADGGCPPAFLPLTEAEQLELAEDLGIPAEVVASALDQYDRNADRTLCFLAPRGEIKVLPGGHVNIVDNTLAR